MSTSEAPPPSRSLPPSHPAPAHSPLIAPTGSPGLNSVIDVVNSTAAPFQSAPPPEGGVCGAVAQGVGGVLGVIGAPTMIIDTAFASLTAPIAAMFPALPAITLGGMHVGTPHAHAHPPSLIPPAPPVPLPSIGALMGSGSITVLLGGMPAARAGDIGIAATCGSLAPPFCVYTGSSNVFIGGARAARMGDITQHCNPQGGAAMGAFAIAMSAAAIAAGAAGAVAGGSPWAGAQAAADAAVLAMRLLCGKDPGVPPCVGALLGPPVPNVLIGGFPCPPIGEMAVGGILKALKALGRAMKSRSSKAGNGKCANGSHPIYLVTGENFDEFTDFVSGGLFTWKRHYTTARARVDSPLGHGFRHFYQRTLRLRLNRATFTTWDGVDIEFPRFERGSNVTRSNGYVLARLERGHYKLSYRNEPAMHFTGDEFGAALRLTKLETTDRELSFAYDDVGRLAGAVEREKRTHATRRYELRYDAENHVTHLLELPAFAESAWSKPEPTVRAAYLYAGGAVQTNAWNANGASWQYEYDAFRRWTLQRDPRGYTYKFRYDAVGRCVEASGQDGLWWCKVDYYPDQRLTKYVEGDDAHWEYHYDSDGFVTKIVDPYGGVKTRERDGEGKVVREVDSGGRAVEWLYDADGAHYARRDRFGNTFLPEADLANPPNPFTRWLPRNALGFTFAGALEASAQAIYGADASILYFVPPELEARARDELRIRPAELSSWNRPRTKPRVERDPMGRKISETDVLGRTRAWQYDAAGNLTGLRDRDGAISTRTTISWNLTGERADAAGAAMRYEYSRLEQVVGVTDPRGNVTRYDYDLKERLVRVHRHGRLREEYVYDEGDHFVEKRSGDGAILFVNEPHENHFVGLRRLASGGFHRYDYDARGRIVEASTEAHEIHLEYDHGRAPDRDMRDGLGVEHRRFADGTEVTQVFGRFPLARRRTGKTELVMDHASGRKTAVIHDDHGSVRRYCSNGTVEVLQFDEDGRLTARFTQRRDELGRTQAFGTYYRYSGEGDLVRVEDSVRGTTSYEVDAAHALVAEITPRGERHPYVRDAAGNVTTKPGLYGLRIGEGNRCEYSGEEAFEYDARDRLCSRRATDGTETRYEYDSYDMLRRVVRTAADGTPLLSWSAEYDALGRRLWCGTEDDRRDFYWDGDRLAAEVFSDGRLRVFHYVSREALVPLSFTEYASRHDDPAGGTEYHVFSNQVGAPLHIEDAEGNVVWWSNRIDPYGDVDLRPGAKLEYSLRFPGHYRDRETGLHYNRYRYYDPALGRYLQSDPIGYGGSTVNLYAYCPNPLVQVDILGLEHEGRVGKGGGDDGSGDHGGREHPPGGDEAPPKALKDMSHEELKAHCQERAEALHEAYMDAAPNEAKRTTLSVGVVESNGDPATRKVVVTTSADNQDLHPAVVEAMHPSEEGRVAPPHVDRTDPYPNPDYDPNGPENPRTNPKTKTDAVIVDPETGETTPYEKASRGDPPEGTQHHAEQRMENGAAENNEEVLAQAPTRNCCSGCQQTLGPEGLSKIPTSLSGL